MVDHQRVRALNRAADRRGRYVLYWMQASQRAACNHALEAAIEAADRRNLPVVAGFGLTDDYPEANERHYAFMLEGLAETARALADRGVRLVLRRGAPDDVALELAGDAAAVVADRGYLRHQDRWRQRVADEAPCPVLEVEAEVVVPTGAATDKAEYAARTIRPKLRGRWDDFLVPLSEARPRRDSLGMRIDGEDADDVDGLLAGLDVSREIGRTSHFRGGTSRARGLLGVFIRDSLADYADRRNDPSLHIESHMSPYLHFGQIAPLEVALAVRDADAPREAREAYIEELLVRRELSINYVLHTADYDRYDALPDWARKTLDEHRRDRREYVYSAEDLAAARTHDAYWNAAMTEMRRTGKMHNYMRMYWGKKILEWTESPEDAFETMLALNNAWFLDGRDPNSYANVAWCFGLHDRPWKERDVFGKVRYMNANGLRRKFDIEEYVAWADALK